MCVFVCVCVCGGGISLTLLFQALQSNREGLETVRELVCATTLLYNIIFSVMESTEKHQRSLSFTCGVLVLFLQLRLGLTGDCPADGRTWVPFGDGCYHFVHGAEDKIKSYTFDRAKTLCQGFELLTIQSAEENDFVFKYSPEVWKNNVNIWLGMYYDTNSDNMKWFGEKPVGFSNWEDSSSPSDLMPLDTCVALHTNTGKWENVSCLEQAENGVVCETDQKAEEVKQKPSALLSALVILSVVAIMGVSAVIWFLHQKRNLGTSIFTPFEYHPPFRVLDSDRSCLVEAEENDNVP